MEIFGVAITLLSIVIAYQTWKNGKGMQEMMKRMQEMMRTIHEEGERRHGEVIELLKRGFGDLSKDIGEVKTAIKQ